MPSLFTHHYFASLMIEKYKKVLPFLLDHYSVVTLGAQGPDPLFFYGHAPFSGRKEAKKTNDVGSLLHAEPHLLIDLLLLKKTDISNIELSYLLGALTHYVLDRTFHPYVFFHTGFDQHGELVPPFQGAHGKFEVSLDVAVKFFHNLDPHIFHPQVTLGVSDEALTLIDGMYQSVYPEMIQKGEFTLAVEDMKKTLSFLYHANFFKKALVFLVAGKTSLPYNLIHPKTLSAQIMNRLFNVDKTPYQDPVTGRMYDDSIEELFIKASALFDQFFSVLFQSELNQIETRKALIALIKEIDYDGKPVGSTMSIFVPFYKGFEK